MCKVRKAQRDASNNQNTGGGRERGNSTRAHKSPGSEAGSLFSFLLILSGYHRSDVLSGGAEELLRSQRDSGVLQKETHQQLLCTLVRLDITEAYFHLVIFLPRGGIHPCKRGEPSKGKTRQSSHSSLCENKGEKEKKNPQPEHLLDSAATPKQVHEQNNLRLKKMENPNPNPHFLSKLPLFYVQLNIVLVLLCDR